MSNISFILIDVPRRASSNLSPTPSLIEEWELAFTKHLQRSDLERFTFLESRLNHLQPFQVTFDCIVSPANSYGIMDGGFDFYLSQTFASPKDPHALTRLVQSAIRERYYGFAPPGTCLLVPGFPSNEFGCRTIAVCPTMRQPEILTWHKDIVYNTMWSLLVELERWNTRAKDEGRIKTVLMTGLGTGVGKIPAADCARQMALAVKHFLHAKREWVQKEWDGEDYLSWDKALNLAKEV